MDIGKTRTSWIWTKDCYSSARTWQAPSEIDAHPATLRVRRRRVVVDVRKRNSPTTCDTRNIKIHGARAGAELAASHHTNMLNMPLYAKRIQNAAFKKSANIQSNWPWITHAGTHIRERDKSAFVGFATFFKRRQGFIKLTRDAMHKLRIQYRDTNPLRKQ